MMNNNDEVMVNLLKDIFSNVNNWLMFIETKNAGLLALNIAIISAIVGIENMKDNYLYLIAVFLCLCSTIISLWSFKPKYKCEKSNIGSSNNLLFFSDIANYSNGNKVREYLLKVSEKYDIDIDRQNIPLLAMDLSEEIIINSAITQRKSKLFTTALWFDLIAIILIVINLFVLCIF